MLKAAAGKTIRRIPPSSASAGLAALRASLVKALMLLCCLGAALGASSQNAAPPAATQTPEAPKPAQQIQRVTTTVVVHGEVKDDYLPEAVTVGTLDGATLAETPLSATVVTRDLLSDQVSRLLSDVLRRLRDSRLPHRPGHGTPGQRHDHRRRAGRAA
ncbi:MAG: hypothetical protein ABSD43_15150 [Terracidiphilus sp.]